MDSLEEELALVKELLKHERVAHSNAVDGWNAETAKAIAWRKAAEASWEACTTCGSHGNRNRAKEALAAARALEEGAE